MKNCFKIITLLLIVFLLSGCGNPKKKILSSIEYLSDPTYYVIHNELTCTDDNNNSTLDLSVSFTFDEISNLSERSINIKNIPHSTEIFEVAESKIIKYYGYYEPHESLENSYYLKEWLKEEMDLTDDNKSKYILLDKNYYIELIKNAKEYSKFNGRYDAIVSSEEFKKIIYQMVDDCDIITDDIYISLKFDSNKRLDFTNQSFYSEKYGYCVHSFGFQTEFEEGSETKLEIPM